MRDEIDAVQAVWPVSRETIQRFETYRELLERWQTRTNLVAPGTLKQFWKRHVADSLQVKALFPDALRFADLGSGAGFPGLVLAITGAEETLSEFHLVESLQKKCAFLRTVARETGARIVLHNERIESVTKQLSQLSPAIEIVTARALAPLPKLLDLAEPLLGKGAVGLFHKGREYRSEIEECHGLWRFDLVVHESRIETGSVLLEIRDPVRNSD